MQEITVIIIEDHEVSLNGLVTGLSAQQGISVIGMATNSDDGLVLARTVRPDVILLDLHLPGTSGPRSMVRDFCNIAGSRVLVFSVENRPAFIETVMQLGAAGYLLKSESIAKVADTIRRIMSSPEAVVSKELAAAPDTKKLTPSEQEVLKMLARGMKYQTIAEHRGSTPGTIRKQCEMLLLKLGLETREELIAWAVSSGYGGLEL